MHPVARDLRYGVRLLRNSPGFTVVALLALALGMGATTAIFSVVDAVLLKPLPFRDPGRLLAIWEKNGAGKQDHVFVAAGNFLQWRNQSRLLEGMAAIQDVHVNLTGGPNGHMEPEELEAERVSADLFPLLGVQPVVGRAFRPEEDQPGRTAFALLSYEFWQRRFGADAAIAGKTLRLRGESYTVVGVLPAGFSVLHPGVQIWIPLGLDPGDTRAARSRSLAVIARLRPGVGIEQARAEMAAIGRRLEGDNPALNRGWQPSVFPLEHELLGQVRQPLAALAAAIGFLLLIACVNIANLLLARGATRRREIAIRAAMGASRGRIFAQLLIESVLLAMAGALPGLALARGGLALLAALGPADIPRLLEARIDARVFLFALAISAATGVLFGIAPALQGCGADLNADLMEGGRGGTIGRRGRMARNALVVSEVALAVLLLIGAGLLVRSFIRLRSVDPGFRPPGLITLRLPLAGGRNSSPDRRIAFVGEVVDLIREVPGVREAGATNGLPLTGLGMGATFVVDGRPAPPPAERPIGLVRSVTPGYFHAMGIPLLAGREFRESDNARAPAVVLVDRALARRFRTAPGGRLVLDLDERLTAEIVGIVGDVKPERMDSEEWPTIYRPFAQAPLGIMTIVARTGGPLDLAAAPIRRIVQRLDPDQPVANLRPMESVVDETVAGARFHAVLFAICAQVAFALAAVGIYGVISYDVSERMHELGIRMALGAQRGDVLRLVLGRAARLVACGIALGLAGAWALTRLMAAMLYGVQPTDAFTFAGTSALLAAVGLAAGYLPSRRAMALDPLAALRHE